MIYTKALKLIVFTFIFINEIESQTDFIPLIIDSSFYGAITNGNWTTTFDAYSYDNNDSLIQIRKPFERFSYQYEDDTTIIVREALDQDNNWKITNRKRIIYNDIGLKLIEFGESLNGNNEWYTSSRGIYSYNSSNKDTLYEEQNRQGGVWSNFYKRNQIYDQNNNLLEVANYYTNSNDEYVYNSGRFYEYDSNNNRIQYIGKSGIHFTSRTNWYYNDMNVLDSFKMCNYNDLQECLNRHFYEYTYFEDSIQVDWSNWTNNSWNYAGKEIIFKGDNPYNDDPDSTLTYFKNDTIYWLRVREYYNFFELNNNTIYYKNEAFTRYSIEGEWERTKVFEAWYHLPQPVNLIEQKNTSINFKIFPNPVNANEQIMLRNSTKLQENGEVLIFNNLGQLIFRKIINLNSENLIESPNLGGVYNIVIICNDKLIGVSKLVVK